MDHSSGERREACKDCLSQFGGRRRTLHVLAKQIEWRGAMALVAAGSLVAHMCAQAKYTRAGLANTFATFHDRVLGFLPARTWQAPGKERPRAVLANRLCTFLARVLGFLLFLIKKKIKFILFRKVARTQEPAHEMCII